MGRNTYGPRLFDDGSRDGLSNPPGGKGRQPVTPLIFKPIHGFNQTDIALLDEIEELQSLVGVLFGN